MNFERKTCTGVHETQVFHFADIFLVRVDPPPLSLSLSVSQLGIQAGLHPGLRGPENYVRDTFYCFSNITLIILYLKFYKNV